MVIPRLKRTLAITTALLVASSFAVFSFSSLAASATPPPLGAPDHIGLISPNVDALRQQLQAGTGTQFGSVKTSTVEVKVDGTTHHVTLRTSASNAGGPFTVLEQASPAVGPWAVGPHKTNTFLSYAVDDVAASGAVLQSAGFALTAQTVNPHNGFAFWKGAGGILVRLLDTDNAPTATSSEHGALGPLTSVTFAPCQDERATVESQLKTGLGISWKIPLLLPLPWNYADGSIKAPLMRVLASQERAPHVTIETPEPVHACAPGYAPSHVVFFTLNIVGAEQRLVNAGMTFAARVPLAVTYVQATGGINIEVASSTFVLAELLP